MKELPIGIQTFESLRETSNNYVYVDKTHEIYQLAKGGPKRYFLSRPRRFGKSLLCSTLQSLFEGRKDLFEGLWIEQSDWQWVQRPVIHISFAGVQRDTPEALSAYLSKEIVTLGTLHGVTDLDVTLAPGYLLKTLVRALSVNNSVVVIIDEYDKPILDHITNVTVAQQMRDILKNFYEVIKDLDQYIHFVLLTGVTKFTKTSIFSGINNLNDISLDSVGATICGFTHKELVYNFAEHIQTHAKKQRLSEQELISKLTLWYDGYRFSDESDEKIYNPFSLLCSLEKKQFRNYWFETGTPTFLLKLIQTNNYPAIEMNNARVASNEMTTYEVTQLDLYVLLQQTGYLTIKNYDENSDNYTLTYPNKEVADSLSKLMLNGMTNMRQALMNDYVEWFRQALRAGDIEHFCKTLQQFFSEIPYTIQIDGVERYYQTIFFIICRLLTRDVYVEVATNIGRIDAVIEFQERVVIIEFKVKDSSFVAMKQIKDRNYAQAFRSSGKQLLGVGLQFDTEKRNLSDDWIIKELTLT